MLSLDMNHGEIVRRGGVRWTIKDGVVIDNARLRAALLPALEKPMKNPTKVLLGFVALTVMLLFLGGIILAAIHTGSGQPDQMPTIATYLVSSVNGILAANLGAILGVTVLRAGFADGLGAVEKLQWTAAGFYMLMILLVVFIWAKADFTEEASMIVSVIPEIGRTGIGILLAIFAAALGVQSGVRAKQRDA